MVEVLSYLQLSNILYQEIIAQENNVENADIVRYLGLLMAYFKQYEGEYWNDNKNCWSEKTTQFYTEREWRYIPIVQDYEAYYLDPKDFKDKVIRNRKRKQLIEHNYTLKFEWNDIESIGVIGWSKKIKIVNFLMKHSIGFIEAWSKIKVLEKWHF